MGLSKVEQIYKGVCRTVRNGYKVFMLYPDAERIYSPFYPSEPLPADKWLDESRYRAEGSADFIQTGGGRYPIGWHVFLEEGGAIKSAIERLDHNLLFGLYLAIFVVREVQCKGLLARGYQARDKVNVYKYIRVGKEVRRYDADWLEGEKWKHPDPLQTSLKGRLLLK